MKTIFYFSIILLGCFLFSCNPEGKKNFINVRDSKLMLNGKEYNFLGTNLWYGCYLAIPGNETGRKRLLRELDRLSTIGITNIRLIGASEESKIKNSLKPAFQTSPGKYNEQLLQGLDFVLAEMQKRKMYAVIFLNNYWEWSGGMLQYISWATGNPPDDPSSGIDWDELMTREAGFYSNEKANELYRNYIKMLVNRKNSISGKSYKNDNTIMAWELANEPRGGEGRSNLGKKDIFCKWVDETAGFIHSLDNNHLVTTGSEGAIGCKGDYELFKRSHISKNIDYLTIHLWPKNWDWFKADSAEYTFNRSIEKSLDYINRHIEDARTLKKPLVMEEFGFNRDSSNFTSKSSVILRNKFFTAVLNLTKDSIKKGSPFCGVNFWGWSGEGRPGHPGGVWQKGDDMIVKPPFEFQGINSVYDIEIGRAHV